MLQQVVLNKIYTQEIHQKSKAIQGVIQIVVNSLINYDFKILCFRENKKNY